MTEHRGPDAKKVYSFRFSPNDLIHWRLAAESRGLTLNAWIERNNNISLYDFALGLIDAGTYPGRRSKLMGLQAQLLIDARRKEDGDAEPPSSEPQERLRGDRDVAVDRRSTGKSGGADTESPAVSKANKGHADAVDPDGTGTELQEVVFVTGDPVLSKVCMVPVGETSVDALLTTAVVEPPQPELAKQILAKRGCCVHGTQRGFNCWQCRGKAKIAGDPETLSKREQAKAEREQAKASKKKGKGRR